MRYLSAKQYSDYLGIDKSAFIAYVESEELVYDGMVISDEGEMKGIEYRSFTNDFGEEIDFVAYPLGVIDENDILDYQ